MKIFTEQTFAIPALKGISQKTVDEHLKLYSGYVKNVNEILASGEYNRRFPFEFDGMRNHEYYFKHFEGGPVGVLTPSAFYQAVEAEWGTFDNWLNSFKALALTRGVGWAMLYYDKQSGQLLNSWVDEQHLGHLTGLSPVLALDMWEHSFVMDYAPSGKKQYVEDFFANLNWDTVSANFEASIR